MALTRRSQQDGHLGKGMGNCSRFCIGSAILGQERERRQHGARIHVKVRETIQKKTFHCPSNLLVTPDH